MSGADDKTVIVWDLARAHVVRRIRGHRERIQSLAISRDGSKLATAALDGSVKLWNLNDPTDRAPNLRFESAVAVDGSISPMGTRLAFRPSKQASQIDVWNIPLAKPTSPILFDPVEFDQFSWSADDRLLAFASHARSEAYAWDLNRAEVIRTVKFATRLSARVLVLSPHGGDVVTQNHAQGVTIHNLQSGTSRPLAYPEPVIDACFFPDGTTAACIGFLDGDVHLFSTDGGSHRVLNAAMDRPPGSLNVSQDARFVVVGDQGGVVRVVNVDSGRLHRVLRGHENEVTCVAISHHGQTVASADVDGFVRLWHVETGELLTTFSTHHAKPRQIVFAPDDSALLCWCQAYVASDEGTEFSGAELYVWSARRQH